MSLIDPILALRSELKDSHTSVRLSLCDYPIITANSKTIPRDTLLSMDSLWVSFEAGLNAASRISDMLLQLVTAGSG